MPSEDDAELFDSFLHEAAAISEVALDEALPLPGLEPGEVVSGRFLVEMRSGGGGMGAVYRALDQSTNRRVALKIMAKPRRSGAERFAREARVLAELAHPAVVQYVAHGATSRGLAFLAMDWLDGVDLAARLARTRLTLSETFALMRRACEGLAAAHAKGIIHRDIKPSNLFLVGEDPAMCKVIDFGVAYVETGAHSLTRPGTSLGTVGYMAPEQALEATDVDARADVYAMGCVLYECLTGRAAFAGRPVAVLAKVLRDLPPPPSHLLPELSEAIDELTMTLLAKDRGQRPRDAAELLRHLQPFERRPSTLASV